jgi:uncharacterized protein YndB with AHSA1/START domain
MTMETALVVRRSVAVNVPPERAFEVFTSDVASWWPVATHSVADGTPAFEPRVGGRLFERVGDVEHFWGKVVAWDPPHRLALEWKVNPDAAASTDVEITFTPDGDGTLVALVHSGFERLGEKGPEGSGSYGEGWVVVLGRYAERANTA